MRATRRSWTIRQTCFKLITYSIYHDFKLSLMAVYFAGPNIVLAYDRHHQSNSKNASSFFRMKLRCFSESFQIGMEVWKKSFHVISEHMHLGE